MRRQLRAEIDDDIVHGCPELGQSREVGAQLLVKRSGSGHFLQGCQRCKVREVTGQALELQDVGNGDVIERAQDGAEKGPSVLSQLLRGQNDGRVVQLPIHPLVVRRQERKVGSRRHC